MERLRLAARCCIWGMLFLSGASPAFSYSLLTHEQIIDLTWDDAIEPLLLSRFPNATHEQLEQARAYAYGGCVIQDIGYYPFGEVSFSDLTHYVRSGDFVVNLFRDATDLNELAFAVGALSHYIGDSIGHPMATNLAVPIEFPSLRDKYGQKVNYAEGKQQHVQVEFGFDIDEAAHHRMAPLNYLRHIGLEVAMRQLSLAYYQTYGISTDFSGSRGRRVNVRAYRFAVRTFIPRISEALVLLHRKHEPADVNTPEAVALRSEIRAMDTANDWPHYRRKEGIGLWTLAAILWVVPKVGPLKLAAIKGPTPQAEADYQHSLAQSTAAMRRMLWRFTPPDKRRPPPQSPGVDARTEEPSHELAQSGRARSVSEVRMDPRHPLPNRDLDTGDVVKPGGYPLTDNTYADLLHSLASQPNLTIPPGIKEDIEAYYSNLDAPISTKKDPQRWAQVQRDLVTLESMPTNPLPETFPTYETGVVGKQ
jgi:Zinc dependent phospholipase C